MNTRPIHLDLPPGSPAETPVSAPAQTRRDRRPRHAARRGCRGTVMTEFVLVMPLLMLVLALLFYFGSLAVRTQQANTLARYEVWRSATDGLGPAASHGNTRALDRTFFPDQSSRVRRSFSIADFPDAPYRLLVDAAETQSADAGHLAFAWTHRPDGGDRQPRGLGQRFEVRHADAARNWARIDAFAGNDETNPEHTPLSRSQLRIRHDWAYTDDWRAAAPHWLADLDGSTAPAETTRDAFLEALDHMLETESRAQARRSGRDADHTLPGLMRSFYLHTPPYRGPTVLD